MNIDDIRKVLEAWAAKQPIQMRVSNFSSWQDVVTEPPWNFQGMEFRVKPSGPREWWEVRDRVNGAFFGSWNTKEQAAAAALIDNAEVVHVREVIEEVDNRR